jgi:hypothetical protein
MSCAETLMANSARGAADRLIPREGIRDLIVLGELVGEHDCVLDGLGCALADSRGGRVGRVAE